MTTYDVLPESGDRRRRHRRHPVGYCASAGILVVGGAAARTLFRLYTGDTPGMYALPTFLVHLGLWLLPALAVGLGWGLVRRRGLSGTGGAGFRDHLVRVTALSAVFGLYLLLNFEPGRAGPRQTGAWSSAALLFLVLLWVTARGLGRRSTSAAWVVTGLGLLGIVGTQLISGRGTGAGADQLRDRADTSGPPVLVILVDTLRADHLTTYGYGLPTSPNVDALAEDATVYTRAFSTAPWTRPACASLMTSRLPSELGIRDRDHGVPPTVPTWAELMAEEGYRTAAIVANVQAGPVFGFDRGFHDFDIGPSYLRYTGARTALSRLRLIDYRSTYPRYDARALTSRALRRLDRRDPARPLFLYLHYADPHAPYAPPEADDRWRDFAPAAARAIEEPPFSPHFWADGKVEGLALQAMVARYDAEIAFFDQQLGRLMAHLKAIDLYDEALIILTSDHGEEFQDHGGWAHGGSLYNELIRVPLIVKYPRALGHTGERVHETASLVDLLPTTRDLLGASWPPDAFRGRSLLSSAAAGVDRILYAESSGRARRRSAVQGRHKLIQNLSPEGVVTSERYFHLERDFSERRPQDPENALAAERLESLRAWLQEQYVAAESSAVTLDTQTLEELRALGYVD